MPRRAPNFSKLLKLVHRSPHFDLISSEIVFTYFCAQAVSKKKIEGVKLLGLGGLEDILGGGGHVKKQNLWGGEGTLKKQKF